MNAENGQQLFDACIARDIVLVRSLVSSGEASVNFQTPGGDTPLMVCSARGMYAPLCSGGDYTDILTYLIVQGANLDLANLGGFTALILATMDGEYLSMAALLRHGANADLVDNHGDTALMWSAMYNSHECMILLLQNGVAVDTVDTDGRTALWFASRTGSLPIVELLVEGGADIEIADNKGKKARDIARERNHTAVVEYLRTPLIDKRWLRRSGLAMVRSSIRDVEDPNRGPIIRALQCDDVAREIGSWL
jgi:ankyrin repeat protein